MGTCSSSSKTKRIRKINNPQNNKLCFKEKTHHKTNLKSNHIKKTLNQELNQTINDLPLDCLGYLVGSKRDTQGKIQKDIIGLGCIISKNMLFVSDHYSYIYSSQDLQFHPFDHEQQEKAISIKRTIFPQSKIKDKKSSMYLHKRLGVALYQLSEPILSARYFKLGINILPQASQESNLEDIVAQKLIHQSSRLYFSITHNKLLEKGWPLLYKLYDEYYCIGLFSNMNYSDYLLLDDRIVNHLQNSEQKYMGVDTIQVIQICQAFAEIKVIDRNRSFITALQDQLHTARLNSDKIQCAELLFRIAVQYGTRGELQRQMQLYFESLNIYSTPQAEADHLQNIAQLYHNIGLCLSEQGMNVKAEKYLLQALEVKKRIYPCGRSESIGDTLNQLGVNSKNQQKFTQSNSYYNEALKIYRESGSSQKENYVLNNINLLLQQNQNHSKNMQQLGTTLMNLIKIKGQNCIQVAKIYFNLSIVERESKNYGNSLTFLCKSMNIMKNLGLQRHFEYQKISKEVKSIKCEIEQYNLKRQWALKAAGLIKMI